MRVPAVRMLPLQSTHPGRRTGPGPVTPAPALPPAYGCRELPLPPAHCILEKAELETKCRWNVSSLRNAQSFGSLAGQCGAEGVAKAGRNTGSHPELATERRGLPGSAPTRPRLQSMALTDRGCSRWAGCSPRNVCVKPWFLWPTWD